MLRVAEHFEDSDVGRQREGNEDSFFVRVPLFVVADGMGGAQAGEVASSMAVGSFQDGIGDGDHQRRLVEIVERANRQIHELSQSDSQRTGMGTTLTAAYVAGDDVVVAHVGDSRCYMLRDGDLVRLTQDHSLVGELVARGKLTEEQAEMHPQRSVITRALGPEPHVQVDVDVFPARDGDVFLLCSDGLTSMIPEGSVKRHLLEASSLDEAGRALIAAANRAGGRDNITVLLFRMTEVAEPGARRGESQETGETTQLAALDAAAAAPAGVAAGQAGREGSKGISAAHGDGSASSATEPVGRRSAVPVARPTDPRSEKPRRRRSYAGPVLLAFLVFTVLAALWIASRAVYFVGVDQARSNTVSIYRGVPYELPFGVRLYERFYNSGVTFESVPPSRRDVFTDHKLRSRDDAENLVISLERGELNK